MRMNSRLQDGRGGRRQDGARQGILYDPTYGRWIDTQAKINPSQEESGGMADDRVRTAPGQPVSSVRLVLNQPVPTAGLARPGCLPGRFCCAWPRGLSKGRVSGKTSEV